MKRQKRSLCLNFNTTCTFWKHFVKCLMFRRSWCIKSSSDENASLRAWKLDGLEWILPPDLKYRTFYFSHLDKLEKSLTFQNPKLYPFQTPDFLPNCVSWCFSMQFLNVMPKSSVSFSTQKSLLSGVLSDENIRAIYGISIHATYTLKMMQFDIE